MKYNLKSSEKLSLMNIQSNHIKAWYLYFPLIIMLNDIYFSILILICCHSANFDFLIYIFAQLGSRCLIVAFKLGASIKYPTLYLHQHPIPIFFFLVNLISKIHLIISNFFKHPPLWLFSTSIKYLTLITPYPSHTWYENSCFPPKAINKVNRCLARYSPRATTTNRPTKRALNKPAWPGPNWPKMPILGQIWLFLGKKSFFFYLRNQKFCYPHNGKPT